MPMPRTRLLAGSLDRLGAGKSIAVASVCGSPRAPVKTLLAHRRSAKTRRRSNPRSERDVATFPREGRIGEAGTHELLRRCTFMPRIAVNRRTSAGKKAEAGLDEDETRPRQVMPWARSVHGAATVTRVAKRPRPELADLPVPNMLEVVTFFRARGDSYARIASIGFWSHENPGKALTARELKVWFEGELKRREAKSSAAKASGPRPAGKRA